MPKTVVRSRTVTLKTKIRQADPNYDKDKRREVEYEFTGRKFYGDPSKRGVYSPDA